MNWLKKLFSGGQKAEKVPPATREKPQIDALNAMAVVVSLPDPVVFQAADFPTIPHKKKPANVGRSVLCVVRQGAAPEDVLGYLRAFLERRTDVTLLEDTEVLYQAFDKQAWPTEAALPFIIAAHGNLAGRKLHDEPYGDLRNLKYFDEKDHTGRRICWYTIIGTKW